MNNDTFITKLYLRYRSLVQNKDLKEQRQTPVLSKASFERISGLILKGGKFENIFKPAGVNFDQFSLLLNIFIRKKLIKIKNNGIIIPSNRVKLEKILRTPEFCILKKDIEYFWKIELNQYPCNKQARENRIKLFCEYFPINRTINVAILGDGDRNSLSLASQENVKITSFEKDIELIKELKKNSIRFSLPVKFVKRDLRKPLYNFFNQYDLFMCDPPYTLNGLCCWIQRGYELLKVNESCLAFIFFANDMLPQNDKEKLLEFVSKLGARLVEFRRSFNSYKHPKHYAQYKRAQEFASKYGIANARFENWGAWSHVLILEFFKIKSSIKKEAVFFDNIYYLK